MSALKNFYKKYNNNKGAVAILLVLLVLVVTLLISTGLATIFLQELKGSGLIGRSAVAFYAADAGAEYALYQMINADPPVEAGSKTELLSSGGSFDVSWSAGGINSLGEYGGTRRKVELGF